MGGDACHPPDEEKSDEHALVVFSRSVWAKFSFIRSENRETHIDSKGTALIPDSTYEIPREIVHIHI